MHAFTPFYSPFAPSLLVPIVLVIALWTVVLKGYALWFSAKANQKWWFIALLVINTLGLLEIVYLIWFRPKGGVKEVEAETLPVHTSSAAE